MTELESFDTSGNHVATFTTDELTALCPFDFGGPDYYTLTIRYEPDDLAVESKSLKKYLQDFRDQEITVEELAHWIHLDIREAIQPESIYVKVEQARRGGIEETVEKGDYELRQ